MSREPVRAPVAGRGAAPSDYAGATGGIEDIYPLAPLQQGILFESLYAATSDAYVVQLVYSVAGPLDVQAFAEAWQAVIDRHSALRTDFDWEEVEEPVQVVYRRVPAPFVFLDWRHEAGASDTRLHELAASDRALGFQLSRAPLFRVTLVRAADDSFFLVWTHHLLLVDGWSSALVVLDVFRSYAAIMQGTGPPPGHAPPYRDYVAWLRERDLGAAETYWRRTLAGFEAPTPLPVPAFAAPRRDCPSSFGSRELALPASLTETVDTFARRHRLTPSTLAQAAWAVLLSRHSGEEDVVFGVTLSGRPAELHGAEAIVGLFINTLPLRVRVPAREKVLPWLRQLQAAQLELREYEHSPLVKVQGWSDVPRGLPLFETVLVFENYPRPTADAAPQRPDGFEVRKLFAHERTSYPLTAFVAPGDGMSLRLDYDAHRDAANDIDRLLLRWRTLLESLVASPDATLSELSFLSADEQAELERSSGKDVLIPLDGCIHDHFESQVDRTPDEVALVDDDRTITYRELDRRANELAHDLRTLGVGPEAVVALSLERGIEFLVGMIGILKAGGAWLPIDVASPSARKQFIVDDAGAVAVLTRAAFAAEFDPASARVVCVDTDWPRVPKSSEARMASHALPDNAAYVLYTSGSTGQPKGVIGTHRGVVNTLFWFWDAYPFAADDVCCQKTSIGFGDAVQEILWPLLAGVPTTVVSDETLRDPFQLVQTLAAQSVTRIILVPSLLDVLVDAFPDLGTRLPRLRLWIVSGEEFSASLAKRFGAAAPNATLVNIYGASETSSDATWHRVDGSGGSSGSGRAIGRPLPNLRVRILDSQMQALPAGVPGELHVGGIGLARGYVGRPDLTADAFVPDSFSRRPGERLYRTGDSASFAADGSLEFHGRADRQVKIRGVRVEPREIEAILRTHPGVANAVVAAQGDQAYGKRLVAFVVARESDNVSPPELRRYAAEHLTDPMVPSAFVLLEKLPLTAGGKVDVRALSALSPSRVALEPVDAVPHRPIEELVAGLFASLLEVESVGVHDDFFLLGGHSLLAMQLASRVRATFGIELPLRRIFESRTSKGLADVIESLRRGEHGPRPTVKRAPQGVPVPLSLGQERMWRFDQTVPHSWFFNIPVVARLAGRFDVELFERSLRALVRRHEILCTVFRVVDGVPVQVADRDLALPFAYVDMEAVLEALPTEKRQQAIDLLASAEAARPFDLADRPPFRATLIRVDDSDHTLLLTFHHIACDAWSIEVFFREWPTLYEALRNGAPLPAALPVQYADVAYWQRRWLAEDRYGPELAYWMAQLAGDLPPLVLPKDRAPTETYEFQVGRVSAPLSDQLVTALRALSRHEGATLFMTFLAAFDALLFDLSGQDDFRVGTLIANRNGSEREQLIGLFVNTVLLRAGPSAEMTFRELLRQVRETALAAYDHQEVPFEAVMEVLEHRGAERSSIYQTMFLWQIDSAPPDLPGEILLQIMESPPPGGDPELMATTCELILLVEGGAESLTATLIYRSDLFERDTATRMLERFEKIVQASAANPDLPLSSLTARPEGL